MALIANGGGGRRPPTKTPLTPYQRFKYFGADWPRGETIPYGTSALRMLPGRAIWPEEEVGYTPPTGPPSLGPSVGGWPRALMPLGTLPPQIAMKYPPTWQPTAPGPGPPGAPSPIAPPAAPPIAPGFSDWANLWSPIRESGGGPWDFLKLRPSDWRAMPEGIRGELEEWLRALGWRPGGRWGQFGALDWTRDQPTGERGAAWGAEAFSGLSEGVKPWLWWLYNQKWGEQAVARPETTGWSWA